MSIYEHMPADQYHATHALGSGNLKALLRSPAHYQAQLIAPPTETPAMRLGTLLHTRVLEPDVWQSAVRVIPGDVNERTNAGKARMAALRADAPPETQWIKQDEYDACNAMHASIWGHDAARALLQHVADERREISLFWSDDRFGAPVPCKARFDVWRDDGVIVDIKTTGDARHDEFARNAARLGYHIQAAHYMMGAEHLMGEAPPFWVWLVVETTAPYAVATYVLQWDAYHMGKALAERAYGVYAQCVLDERWPGYSNMLQPLQFPKHALVERVEQIDFTEAN